MLHLGEPLLDQSLLDLELSILQSDREGFRQLRCTSAQSALSLLLASTETTRTSLALCNLLSSTKAAAETCTNSGSLLCTTVAIDEPLCERERAGEGVGEREAKAPAGAGG